MGSLRLATRGSPLALLQTELVADLLREAHAGLEVETVVVTTRGDREAAAPLDRIGGQGVFVKEIETALGVGRADVAVHSAKDMTSVMPEDLVLAAVPERADARDGLVGCALADLPAGGLIATGSARRRAQLAYLRPDLSFTELRGNMARRVAVGESDEVAAAVVAVAAMVRLGWSERVSDVLDPVDVLPQAGQGAIALQCRTDDRETRRLLAAVDHRPSHRAIRAERAVLAALGGSCTVPVGAWASGDGGDAATPLRVIGLAASGDGRVLIRLSREGADPEAVGAEVARALLEGGAAAIEGFGPDTGIGAGPSPGQGT
jgi:hydroxymethylbilane synthase